MFRFFRFCIGESKVCGTEHNIFEGLVGWTEKMTTTQLKPTDCNQTIGCSCSVSNLVGLSVASF